MSDGKPSKEAMIVRLAGAIHAELPVGVPYSTPRDLDDDGYPRKTAKRSGNSGDVHGIN
jgi:hypothetical protein